MKANTYVVKKVKLVNSKLRIEVERLVNNLSRLIHGLSFIKELCYVATTTA